MKYLTVSVARNCLSIFCNVTLICCYVNILNDSSLHLAFASQSKMFEIPFLEKLLSTLINTYYLNDIVDRLHGKITVVVLILCAMFVGAKQQFGQPIQCMLPAHLDRMFSEFLLYSVRSIVPDKFLRSYFQSAIVFSSFLIVVLLIELICIIL